MKPSELLIATVSGDGKSIRFLPKDSVTHLHLIGYSSDVLSSARPGEKSGSFFFTLKEHQTSLIQLVVFRAEYTLSKSRNYPSADLYLVLQSDAGRLCIDLEREYVSNALPQVVYSSKDGLGLRVLIGGTYYTSSRDEERPDERYVPDTNLLVSYLVNDVSEDVVIAVAEKYKAEVTAREQLEKCKIQNLALRRVLERGEGNTPALCFVSGNNAYFTTQDVSRQTGDKWHIGPHTENAGMPNVAPRSILTRPAWDIVCVTWTGPFNVVMHFKDKPLSADDINAMKAPWLEGIKNPHESIGPLLIFAGTHLDRFISNITEFGGTVTVEEVL